MNPALTTRRDGARPSLSTDTSQAAAPTPRRERALVWTGRGLSGLIAVLLILDGAMKLAQPDVVVQGTVELGYPVASIVPIGLSLLACVALYVIPRTSVLGAVCLTGYLGGAIATHVRMESPLFSHTLFPFYVAALAWLGLWLRDRRVRALLPTRRMALANRAEYAPAVLGGPSGNQPG